MILLNSLLILSLSVYDDSIILLDLSTKNKKIVLLLIKVAGACCDVYDCR
jgi:hypothetical protein